MKNYYQILGLEPSATKEDIKKAHREYAINFHPDKQGGSKFFEERFKEIQEAYEILSDDKKRANYDLKFNQRFNNQSYNNTYSSDSERERRERERKEQEQWEREKKEQERKRQEREKYDRAETSKSLSSIRYDGIYYAKNNSSTTYLRFYSDGTVLSVGVGSTGTINEIKRLKRWFNKEHNGISKGIYKIVEGKIFFQAKSISGIVEYNGQVYENKIILNLHSYINGYEEKNREYLFGAW